MYHTLLSSKKVGTIVIPNRIIMPAMTENLADKKGVVVDDNVAYYEQKAKGGTGLIITSYCTVDPKGQAFPNQLCAYDREHIIPLNKIAQAVHRHRSKIFLQLHHAGRVAPSEVIGQQAMAPSAIATRLETGEELEQPYEMSVVEIKEFIDRFIFSAQIAKEAGFDGVELHAAHSYALCQFLSPMSNKRCDEYGGNLENRIRVLKEIVLGIKEQVGSDFPICVRISVNEGSEDGLHLEDAISISGLLETYGVDLLSISAGGYEGSRLCIATAGYAKEGYLVASATAVRRSVSIPVAVVGMIRDFSYAEEILKEKLVDFIVLGRPILADPYLVNKLKENRESEIRPCITCLHCADSSLNSRLECSVNPTLCYEATYDSIRKNGSGKKVLIVGAGVAGCEAARVLALRGYQVYLLEQNSSLGGKVNLIAQTPHNHRMKLLITYYETILKKLKVTIKLNTKVNLKIIGKIKPGAIMIPHRSEPFIWKTQQNNMVDFHDIINKKLNYSEKEILVIGSNNEAIMTAHFLLRTRNKVTLICEEDEVAQHASSNGIYTLGDIMDEGLISYTNLKLEEVKTGSALFRNTVSNETISFLCDAVVVPYVPHYDLDFVDEIGKKYPVYEMGTETENGNISTSIKSAFHVAYYYDNVEEL